MTYYKGSHILMNNGSWIDFSKSGCYSTIYTHFLLIMTMSLKILSDNLGQSSLPSMSQKSWGKKSGFTNFSLRYGRWLSPQWTNLCNFFVGYGGGVCPKALQSLPDSDEICEHGGQKTDILMEVC